MEVSDQRESKRLNDLFPINYFHREKIKSILPLRFEHVYYNQYDRFQVIETGGIFRIDSLPTTNKEYLYYWISGSKELRPGYETFFLWNDEYETLLGDKKSPFGKLRILLGSKDYYHVADILYDLSNEVEEIPDRLFNYIMEICDETNTGK